MLESFKKVDVNAWFDSTQDINCWRVLLNSALNLRAPYIMDLAFIYMDFTHVCEDLLVFTVINDQIAENDVQLPDDFLQNINLNIF